MASQCAGTKTRCNSATNTAAILDEAYLDATENIQGISIAPETATLIRAKILSETGLTASAGISDNKFLAKLASDHRKPNGQFVITPKMRPAFVQDLPLGKFHGIGPAASAKMNGLSIFTGMDMCNQTLEFMNAHLGKAGSYYYWISRDIDERPIRANRIRKFVGAKNTFSQDLADYDALAAKPQRLVDKVWGHCEANGARGRTATLKVKFSDFELITCSRSVAVINTASGFSSLALDLLKHLMPPKKTI
jgi:DNA polymerase-4